MTKAEKIKICREFEKGFSVDAIFCNHPKPLFGHYEIEVALRWGLKTPLPLRRNRKGVKNDNVSQQQKNQN